MTQDFNMKKTRGLNIELRQIDLKNEAFTYRCYILSSDGKEKSVEYIGVSKTCIDFPTYIDSTNILKIEHSKKCIEFVLNKYEEDLDLLRKSGLI